MPTGLKRGQIYWVSLSDTVDPEFKGVHAFVVVSSAAVHKAGLVIAVPTTSQLHQARQPLRPLLEQAEITPSSDKPAALDCVALCDNLRSLSVKRLAGPPCGVLKPSGLVKLEDAMKAALGLPP